jgi:hypothetical protein
VNGVSNLNNPKLVKVGIFAKLGFSSKESGIKLRSLFELNDDGSHIVAADTSYMKLIILNTGPVYANLSERLITRFLSAHFLA